MKQYDVYGLGHAVVDLEYQVTDDFFTKMNIEKGLMTLIDDHQLANLLTALSQYPCKKVSGGSGANSIYTISQMGGKTYYSCKVSDDELGTFYFNDMNSASVDTNLLAIRESGTTGVCLVLVTPDAERTMNTHLGITQSLSVKDINPEAIKASNYLYIEGYLCTAENTSDAATTAREIAQDSGAKIAISFSDPAMVKYYKSNLAKMLGSKVDLLFCNKEEANLWAETDDMNQTISCLQQIAETFVITLGKDGALTFDGKQLHQVSTNAVKAIDTTGAGDAFAGAFLYGITQGLSYELSAQMANFTAAEIVTTLGARTQEHIYQNIAKYAFS